MFFLIIMASTMATTSIYVKGKGHMTFTENPRIENSSHRKGRGKGAGFSLDNSGNPTENPSLWQGRANIISSDENGNITFRENPSASSSTPQLDPLAGARRPRGRGGRVRAQGGRHGEAGSEPQGGLRQEGAGPRVRREGGAGNLVQGGQAEGGGREEGGRLYLRHPFISGAESPADTEDGGELQRSEELPHFEEELQQTKRKKKKKKKKPVQSELVSDELTRSKTGSQSSGLVHGETLAKNGGKEMQDEQTQTEARSARDFETQTPELAYLLETDLDELLEYHLGEIAKITSMKQERERRKIEDRQCVVCLDRDACICFFPCGHVKACEECSASLTTCPCCKLDISQRARAFF